MGPITAGFVLKRNCINIFSMCLYN
ncbi:protein of unknown function [Methanoculleus bourgensis]|uniref:Uncharacterized protein n=1 Tax=Methanoculleus bourgensis TaxID=83986 RepID=A0A0X3BK51_9EURY|nr:protein of unknown function [Methanoculleus bourgensis]